MKLGSSRVPTTATKIRTIAASPATPVTLPRRCHAAAPEVGAGLVIDVHSVATGCGLRRQTHASPANPRFTRSRYERHGASEGRRAMHQESTLPDGTHPNADRRAPWFTPLLSRRSCVPQAQVSGMVRGQPAHPGRCYVGNSDRGGENFWQMDHPGENNKNEASISLQSK